MVERARRFREPVAWFLVACAAVQVLVALGRWYYLHGASRFGWAEAARMLSATPTTLPVVIALAITVPLCALWSPASANARGVGTAATVVLTISVLVSLVMLVVGLGAVSPSPVLLALDLVGGLIDLALKIACIVLVWRLTRAVAAHAPAAPAPTAAEVEKADPAPRQPASWSADKAVGAVWSRAGDAASGAGADGVGASGRGWQPAAREPELPSLPPAAPRRDVPWATAGQQASGEGRGGWQPAADPAPEAAGPRSWQPAGSSEPPTPQQPTDGQPAASEAVPLQQPEGAQSAPSEPTVIWRAQERVDPQV